MTDYIGKKLGGAELLAQLAEEAAELGHAALKLRRVIDGRNPTPVGFNEALAGVMEEVADILNVLDVLGYSLDVEDYRPAMDAKRARWARRLQETEKE